MNTIGFYSDMGSKKCNNLMNVTKKSRLRDIQNKLLIPSGEKGRGGDKQG